MLFKIYLFGQCASFQTPNTTLSKCVSFLCSHPSVRAERWEHGRREGPSEIPLCVGLESFCLCELNIKRSRTAPGSLKWWRAGGIWAEYRTRHVTVQNGFFRSVKTDSTEGPLRATQDQGSGLASQKPRNKESIDSIASYTQRDIKVPLASFEGSDLFF